MEPGEILFLDDTEHIVEKAREYSIHAIPFQETVQAIADIQECLQEYAS